MAQKVDLVMWTKNGSDTLPLVLRRIDEVIPSELVHRRTVVDDQSIDDTRCIAESFNWKVIPNEGTGISDGANTALRHVESDHFVSLEQDLLLTRDWWPRIPSYLHDPKTAAASGMRFASQPTGVREMQRYVARKYRGEAELAPWLRTRQMAAFTLGKTLDNTIYRTEAIRALGGFPKMQVNAGVDAVLAYEVERAGFRWIVDYSVQSVHLRRGLKQELHHQYWYATQLHEIWRRIETVTNRPPPITRTGIMFRFLVSPFTGLFMAFRTGEPTITYVHPLIRFYYLLGLLEASKYEAEPA